MQRAAFAATRDPADAPWLTDRGRAAVEGYLAAGGSLEAAKASTSLKKAPLHLPKSKPPGGLILKWHMCVVALFILYASACSTRAIEWSVLYSARIYAHKM